MGHAKRVLPVVVAAVLATLLATLASACASGTAPRAAATGATVPSATVAALPSAAGSTLKPATITLYTSITQTTVDAVIAAFHTEKPAITVRVFRAPTGSLNARIATDRRTGGLKADVLWVSDPLTMHGYEAQGLLRPYTAPAANSLPPQYRTASFAGAGLLYLVVVRHTGVDPAPASWADLAKPSYRDAVAIPDPGFAGSAMGALGYFGEQAGFGLDFYRQLKANGAVQVKSPEDVITGVAQGRYQLGMTIADSALAAKQKGSPIEVDWPAPGAIAIYSPIGVSATSKHVAAAEAFENFVLSKPGQQALAKGGRQPSLPGVPGIDKPPTAQVVSPDWTAVFADKDSLLSGYQQIFGG